MMETENSNKTVEIMNSEKNLEQAEFQKIIQSSGIEVWSEHQTTLEQQAMFRLELLSKTSHATDGLPNATVTNEDNSITSKEKYNCPLKKEYVLDINSYLNNQAQLQQYHLKQRQSFVSCKSRAIANSISKKQMQKQVPSRYKMKSRTKTSASNNTVVPVFNSKVGTKICRASVVDSCSDSDFVPSECLDSDSDCDAHSTFSRVNRKKHRFQDSRPVKDDSLLNDYTNRLATHTISAVDQNERTGGIHMLDGLSVPIHIWDKLYDYQQEGVGWLWHLHQRQMGGLLCDEMGLGKTVQVIVFLATLFQRHTASNILIVCPATVIHQWVNHLHLWWPPFRVLVLHRCTQSAAADLVNMAVTKDSCCVLVTNYESILRYGRLLAPHHWDYMVLDEGHRIRNPAAKITLAIKELRHVEHRLMVTGSPMQNSLLELWSLFDFVEPGLLGAQQAFMDNVATVITQVGSKNATTADEETAQLLALSLKQLIEPHMLRRSKRDVAGQLQLPDKSEQVLFCTLTNEQKDLYRGYLMTDQVGHLLGRITNSGRNWHSSGQMRAAVLVGITTLRKICNHPDLYLGEAAETTVSPMISDDQNLSAAAPVFGHHSRSGKMTVVASLLKIWKHQGHRVLLFTQGRTMIDIFGDMLARLDYRFLSMTGSTPVTSRQAIIDRFNTDKSYDVFLLTTRVGGLGVNLTGADRVIIFDPDWNPATDLQARERAWRIGQSRQVTIYRLVSAGTIEEKIYQRQVWKQLLSNKVLMDPSTRRVFTLANLSELFSLQEDSCPETVNMFQTSRVPLGNGVRKTGFSTDKIKAMRRRAQQISKGLSGHGGELVSNVRPTSAERLAINRKKMEPLPEASSTNCLDDRETDMNFEAALSIASQSTRQQHDQRAATLKTKTRHGPRVDGHYVDGLVDVRANISKSKKAKIKKGKSFQSRTMPVGDPSNQDLHILERLFSKNGIQSALQHEHIVQSVCSTGTDRLNVHHEARRRADLALMALRRSRLGNWRW